MQNPTTMYNVNLYQKWNSNSIQHQLHLNTLSKCKRITILDQNWITTNTSSKLAAKPIQDSEKTFPFNEDQLQCAPLFQFQGGYLSNLDQPLNSWSFLSKLHSQVNARIVSQNQKMP